ncbi:cystinosin homolog [Actinia tenebrosa]|uniref:Cystinosin homolog n=1 Tax=Actinia tenebrosa TaxID=6105 RepID=A0A6P8IGU7_ACTTE|nr:cystinosin homolog [Actinia tenebrosa]
MVEKLPLKLAAQATGWTYFVVWTISFYPQVYLNWKRKSVVGFSFDYLAINIVGFLSYSIYTLVTYTNSEMQRYFRKENHSKSRDDPVKLTDVVFATHGLAICFFQLGQVCVYERGTQKLKKWIACVCGFALTGIFVLTMVASFSHNSLKMWALVLTYCGYIKSISSFSKVVPQIYLHFKRKSTEGWSIAAIWMDFSGGILSVVQMLIYCVIDGDNTQLTGNIPKLCLSVQSLITDTIFIFQHYILYPSKPISRVKQQAQQDESIKSLINSDTETIG